MLAPTLPDLSKLDREELQALLLAEHQERIATHQQLLRREIEIEHLKLLLSQLRRMQFGRKSEKLERQIEQLELRRRICNKHKPPSRRRTARKVLLENLARLQLPLSRRGVRCRSICHGKPRPICRNLRLVPTAAENCAS